jgi:hypothetical protein
MHSMLQQRVQQVMDDLVASGEEVGLQVAAYVNGDLVVDAWAGVADEATGRLVDGDTLFTSWSTGKGFVATCLHLLAERGQVDFRSRSSGRQPELPSVMSSCCAVAGSAQPKLMEGCDGNRHQPHAYRRG